MTALPDTLCRLDGDDLPLTQPKVSLPGPTSSSAAGRALARRGRVQHRPTVREGALRGVAAGRHVLEGVRIETPRELRGETGIAFDPSRVSEADVRAADEVLLSSTSEEVIAVTRPDGQGAGRGALRGRPGPVYARVHEACQQAIQSQST